MATYIRPSGGENSAFAVGAHAQQPGSVRRIGVLMQTAQRPSHHCAQHSGQS
jgi:hypothetical protein